MILDWSVIESLSPKCIMVDRRILCFFVCFAVTGFPVNSASSCQSPEAGRLPNGAATRHRRAYGSIDVSHPWPWMALIILNSTKPNQIYCAGTLIAPRWILTSASCVLGSRFREAADSVHIRLGVTDRTNLTTAQDVPVEEIKVHELYNASNYANDLALIRLTSTVSYNAFVSPICLPPPFEEISKESPLYKSDETATLLGWGSATKTYDTVYKLRKVALQIISQDVCRASLQEDSHLADGMMCVSTENGSACAGDGGGPLMQSVTSDEGTTWVQVGIPSFGPLCGGNSSPDVYINVAKYVGWIRSVISHPSQSA